MNSEQYRTELEAERTRLLEELGAIGTPDRNNPENWQAVAAESDAPQFRDEVADRLEDFNERNATTNVLERRLQNVDRALEKIKAGTYGICEIGNEPIEEDRLNANPAARTCKTHISREPELL